MDQAPTRLLPPLDEPDTAPFWQACAQHRLTYFHDPHTAQAASLPRRRAPSGTQLEQRDSAGLGTIYTHTVVRKHGHPYFRAHTPYTVAYIDLDEGFRILAEVRGDPDTVHVGQRVEVDWDDQDGAAIPVFRMIDPV